MHDFQTLPISLGSVYLNTEPIFGILKYRYRYRRRYLQYRKMPNTDNKIPSRFVFSVFVNNTECRYRYRGILKYRYRIPNRLLKIPKNTEKPIPTLNTDTDPRLLPIWHCLMRMRLVSRVHEICIWLSVSGFRSRTAYMYHTGNLKPARQR